LRWREHEVRALVEHSRNVTERKWAEEEIRRLNAKLEEKVRQRTATIRRLTSELTLAEQRERARLSHVLHDHLQQLLVAIKFLLHAVFKHASAADRKRLRRVDEILSQSADVARTLAVELSPPILREEGLAAALQWLGNWMEEKHGLHVNVSFGPIPPPLPEAVSVLLYQAVRELLLNVATHARVESAGVALAWLNGQVRVVVEDRGRGIDPVRLQAIAMAEECGLFVVRERLGLLDGHMEIDSVPGRGSRVTLRVPLPKPFAPRTTAKTKAVS
jgi:two-component system, chemotaxis family, CheB/CheR fusion protein